MKGFRAPLLPFLLLLFGLLVSGLAPAQTLEADDVEFMEEAAVGGMFEVKAGELAKTRSTDPDVKSFAEMMVRDHTKMGEELKSLAQRKNVTLPSTLDDDHREKLDELAEKDQDEFDDAYTEMMIDAHEQTVEKFEDTAEDGVDADLRTLASKALPTLRAHEKQAEQLGERRERR